MPATIHNIADYFISKADAEAGDNVTHLKVQKLAYYAQAWHLAIMGSRLFDNEFEAWVHGPVAQELFKRLQGNSWNPLLADHMITVPTDELESETIGFLDEIWDVYGQYTAKALEDLTHQEAPWLEAREGLSPIERSSKAISDETIKTFYRGLLEQNEREEAK